MECKKCGKKIDELNIYCEECKELINKEKELSFLIDKNKELNKLETTKELDTLNDFKNDKKETFSSLKDDLKDIVNIGEEELKLDSDKSSIVIVIVSIVLSLSIIGIGLYFFLNNNKEENIIEEKLKLNYEKILSDYGDSVKLALQDYLQDNEEIPSWGVISDLIEYDDYIITCGIHNVYDDGNIYLTDCKVNNKKIVYTYGVEQQKEEGKKIDIYLNDYSIYNDLEGTQVGSITCKTEDCDYVSAYEKYVLIKEQGKYYIYNYENNIVEFGPFDILDNNYDNNVLVYQNKLYGILYKENENTNIYNINMDKKLKNIKGALIPLNEKYDPTIMYKYGYIIFNNEGIYNFVNLKTGNVSYSIDKELYTFIEDVNKNLVYIITKNLKTNKITIYNSNGKHLFNRNEFNEIRLINKDIVLSTDTKYYIYDSSLKLKLTSKEYNKILGIYDDFVVVVNNEYLELIDLNDSTLATFELKWDDTLYKFDNILSGKVEDVIYIIIERSNSSLKYYYNINTKEFGLK